MQHVTSASPQIDPDMPLNIEFKARCREPQRVRQVLQDMEATLAGVDHQIDTYFHVSSGRLKLRQGNVERNLIYYHREDSAEPKASHVMLVPCPEPEALRELLATALGVKCVVKKKREIYYHLDTKIHIDEVPDLGNFVEVEVIADTANADEDRMRVTCEEWKARLGVGRGDLISSSYSDMMASK